LNCFLSTDRLFKTLKLLKLGHSSLIYLFNTLNCLIADCLLMISKEQTSEVLSLKEVLALVLLLGNREDVLSGSCDYWCGPLIEFQLKSFGVTHQRGHLRLRCLNIRVAPCGQRLHI